MANNQKTIQLLTATLKITDDHRVKSITKSAHKKVEEGKCADFTLKSSTHITTGTLFPPPQPLTTHSLIISLRNNVAMSILLASNPKQQY